MANDLDDLDGAEGGSQPAEAASWSSTCPRDNQTLLIGVTVELEERDDAAWGAWRVSKTTLGDEVLELARDGVPLGLSVGFHEVPGGNRWSPDRRRVVRTRAALDHVAVVRVPADEGAGGWSACEGPQSSAPPRHCSLWPGCTVGKGFKRGVLFGPLDLRSQPRRCIACRRLVVCGGDRCRDCRDQLRQRRRKPR
jgi:hypothetical protein